MLLPPTPAAFLTLASGPPVCRDGANGRLYAVVLGRLAPALRAAAEPRLPAALLADGGRKDAGCTSDARGCGDKPAFGGGTVAPSCLRRPASDSGGRVRLGVGCSGVRFTPRKAVRRRGPLGVAAPAFGVLASPTPVMAVVDGGVSGACCSCAPRLALVGGGDDMGGMSASISTPLALPATLIGEIGGGGGSEGATCCRGVPDAVLRPLGFGVAETLGVVGT